MTIPAAAHAAEEVPGDSLCDAATVEALDALGPLKYEEPVGGAPVYCLYEAPGDGTHSLTLAIIGISFELMQAPDAIIYDVGGQPAYESEGSLLVDLGEDVFAVTRTFADSPDAGGLDLVEYAIDVAEIALPSLTIGPEEAPTAAMEPPAVEGIAWSRADVRTVAEYLDADDGQQAVWEPLVERLGVEASDVSVLSANGRDIESEERLDTYSAIEASGVEGDQLRDAIVDWLVAVSGEGASTEDVSVGGKDVKALVADGDVRGYIYIESSTAHAIPGPEELAARFLAALP